MAHLAQALLTAGEVTGAEAALKEAFAFVEQSGERYWLAELHRLDGEIALHQPEPDPERAEACFLRAIEIAREQESRMLELRAGTRLALLWRDISSPNDPRALLEPILAAIEGGETTRDVRNARAFLAERSHPHSWTKTLEARSYGPTRAVSASMPRHHMAAFLRGSPNSRVLRHSLATGRGPDRRS